MTLSVALALFTTMVVLAVIPGPGILVVLARTFSNGFYAGVITSLGILAGDFVFIALAIIGLSSLSQLLGDFFILVKYIGAAYLIFLGLKILFTAKKPQLDIVSAPKGYSANFLAGFLTTLANPKAILFYVSFFPAFLDLSQVTSFDIAIILLVTTLAVGGVMIGYAYLASRAGKQILHSPFSKYIRYGAGSILVGSGVYVAGRG